MSRYLTSRMLRFTLLELLVVVAILAILASFLLPAVSKARGKAMGTLCNSNWKQVGLSALQFSVDNDDRFPGRGEGTFEIDWMDILNCEYYGGKEMFQKYGDTPQAGKIYCPSMEPYGEVTRYPRAYTLNMNALGGPDWGSNPPEGQYGYVPPELPSCFDKPDTTHYNFGARATIFTDPSHAFLGVESERAAHFWTPRWPYGQVVFGNDPFGVPNGADKATYGFRHHEAANFLFIDGHVEIFRQTEAELFDQPDRYNP